MSEKKNTLQGIDRLIPRPRPVRSHTNHPRSSREFESRHHVPPKTNPRGPNANCSLPRRLCIIGLAVGDPKRNSPCSTAIRAIKTFTT